MAAFTQGVDFNCKGSICYGIADRDIAFRQLQALINGALARLSVGAALAIDGKLGADTVQALLVLAKLPPFMNAPALIAIRDSPKPVTVAQNVPGLLAVLADPTTALNTGFKTGNQMANIRPARSSANLPAPPYVPPLPDGVPSPNGTVAIVPPPSKSHLVWWIGGLAGVALVGALLVHVAHRHHEPIHSPP